MKISCSLTKKYSYFCRHWHFFFFSWWFNNQEYLLYMQKNETQSSFQSILFSFLRSHNTYWQKMKPVLLICRHSFEARWCRREAIDELNERNHDIKRSQLWFALLKNNKTSDRKIFANICSALLNFMKRFHIFWHLLTICFLIMYLKKTEQASENSPEHILV